jgi:uncharacterized GH25 family protein
VDLGNSWRVAYHLSCFCNPEDCAEVKTMISFLSSANRLGFEIRMKPQNPCTYELKSRRGSAKIKATVTFVVAMLTTAMLFGHDLFLRPSSFWLQSPGKTSLTMYLAEAFPGKEEPWRADKTVDLAVSGPGGKQKVKDVAKENPILNLKAEGTYVIGWSATPSYIAIKGAEFEEYIKAEGYEEVMERRKKTGQTSMEGKEKYVRYLKTVVQVGTKFTEDFKTPLGYKIELIPQENPYSLSSGSTINAVALFDGKPLVGAHVMATYDTYSKEHDVYAQTVVTGSDGAFQIKLDHPGVWLIRTNRMLPLSNDPKAEWQSFLGKPFI